MGKTKGKKHNKAASAVSPTGLPSVAQQMKELSTDDLAGIDTVIEKLSSGEAEDREYGCSALGVYFTNPATLTEVLSKNVVRLVSPLLQDGKLSVQVAASAALRGMSEEGGFEACEDMIRQDVVTGLGGFLRKQISDWQSPNQEVKTDGRLHCFINSIYTVQNLCECSALAVRMCIEDSIPEVLLASLDADKYPTQLLLSAAQCLYTMSEENDTIIDLLKVPASQEMLYILLNKESVQPFTKVIIAGVQFNTYGLEMLRMDSKGVIVKTLLSSLSSDLSETLSDTVSICNHTETLVKGKAAVAAANSDADQMDEEGAKPKKSPGKTQTDLLNEIEALDDMISAQKLSFEIITNILGGDDTDEWEDMGDMTDEETGSCGTSASDEQMDDNEIDSDHLLGENSVAGTFADNGLVQLLGQRLKFIEPDLYSKIENTEKTFRRSLQGSVERYDSMLGSALLCLNNTVPQVSVEKFGGWEALKSLPSQLISSLSITQIASQESLVESITSALRSITEYLSKKSQSLTYSEEELNTLHQLTKVTHTATAVNAVRCLAAVGTILSKQPQPSAVVKSIGVVLMEVATSSQQLWLVAEALDSVMDVFAEDYNNVHIKDLGIISTLQSILPQLKSMVENRDKQNDHFLPVLTTVKSNLPRFIKYKKKHV